MTRARNQQIDAATTPYYHCISRCVRRAFLCGEDSLTGKSYEHRKTWVVERLAELSEAFAIDVCAFAVMSSHLHTVLRTDDEQAAGLDDRAVMERWGKLYSLPLLIERYRRDQLDTEAEKEKAQEIIATWRGRLCDISWFMRGLNEHLARRANEEDGCKGRFWEGRFKSQALLDEAAVLTCMSYVDLNPVRAGIADTPEESDFTSIQQGHGRGEATLPADGPRITAATWNRSPPIISSEAEAWWRFRRSPSYLAQAFTISEPLSGQLCGCARLSERRLALQSLAERCGPNDSNKAPLGPARASAVE